MSITCLDCLKLKDENTSLRAEVKKLQDWKESMLEVEKTWDVQAIGKEIGVPWGSGIREHILPAIIKLRAEVEELKNREQVVLLALSEARDEVQRLTALLKESQTYVPKQSIKETSK